MITTSDLLFQNENLIFFFININYQSYFLQIQFTFLQHISILLSLSVMIFNQFNNLLFLIFSQSVNFVNAFFVIFENSVDLQNSISDIIEINELSSTLEQVNCRNMYYIIWNINTKNNFISWWNQCSAVKKIKKSDSQWTYSNWNNAHHKSEFWSQFNQAAVKKTEIFCLICKKCNLVLTHLIYIRNDFSEMKKHIQNWNCVLNFTANCATSDIFIVLINYLQNIMITIYNNNL